MSRAHRTAGTDLGAALGAAAKLKALLSEETERNAVLRVELGRLRDCGASRSFQCGECIACLTVNVERILESWRHTSKALDNANAENTRLSQALADAAGLAGALAGDTADFRERNCTESGGMWDDWTTVIARLRDLSKRATAARKGTSDNAPLRKLCGCGSGQPAGACSFGCQRCGGSGRVGDAPCEACHASGNRPALRSGALQLPGAE